MAWLEKIRRKPEHEKMRIIWIVTALVVAVLIIVWILSSRIHGDTRTDTSLFQTISTGIKKVKQFKLNK